MTGAREESLGNVQPDGARSAEGRDLLIEIGCEEIPARWVADLAEALGRQFAAELRAAGLLGADAGGADPAGAAPLHTPRRLVLRHAGVLARQPDREEETLGPPVRVAFAADGRPSAQGAAFAAKFGAAAESLRRVTTPKGEYVALTRRAPGRPLAEVLSEILDRLIATADLPKRMIWSAAAAERGAGPPLSFVRPIRWLAAWHGAEPLALTLAGLRAAPRSRGQRALGAEEFPVAAAGDYIAALAKQFVLVDPAARRRRIEEGLVAALSEGKPGGFSGGSPGARPGEIWRARADAALLATLVNLVEYPTVARGEFDPDFLELPAEVLVTVMRDHQKYFAVERAPGNRGPAELAPCFLAVMEQAADRAGLIRHGHERVLRARFNDARFFWRQDRKRPLAARREDLKHVTFQAQLGSYYEKTERVAALAAALAPVFAADPALARAAAEVAKCDLTTDLVKEFTELQGVMGGLYARAEGADARVAEAIYDQYLPLTADGAAPRNAEGAALAVADKLDTLAGMFALGEVPTGSRDPFALRRAANGVVRIVLARGAKLPLREWSARALAPFAALSRSEEASAGERHKTAEPAPGKAQGKSPGKAGEETIDKLLAFFRERIEFYLREVEGCAGDEVAAVLAAGAEDARDAAARAAALRRVRGEQPERFAAAAGALKRMRNIVRKEGGVEVWSRREVRAGLAASPAELRLAAAVAEIVAARGGRGAGEEAEEGRHAAELAAIAALAPVLEEFFNTTRVNDPDPELRANRLGLLARAVAELSRVADFGEIVAAG